LELVASLEAGKSVLEDIMNKVVLLSPLEVIF